MFFPEHKPVLFFLLLRSPKQFWAEVSISVSILKHLKGQKEAALGPPCPQGPWPQLHPAVDWKYTVNCVGVKYAWAFFLVSQIQQGKRVHNVFIVWGHIKYADVI